MSIRPSHVFLVSNSPTSPATRAAGSVAKRRPLPGGGHCLDRPGAGDWATNDFVRLDVIVETARPRDAQVLVVLGHSRRPHQQAPRGRVVRCGAQPGWPGWTSGKHAPVPWAAADDVAFQVARGDLPWSGRREDVHRDRSRAGTGGLHGGPGGGPQQRPQRVPGGARRPARGQAGAVLVASASVGTSSAQAAQPFDAGVPRDDLHLAVRQAKGGLRPELTGQLRTRRVRRRPQRRMSLASRRNRIPNMRGIA